MINFLVREKFWIRLVGGALLIVIGLVYWFEKPKSLKEKQEQEVDALCVCDDAPADAHEPDDRPFVYGRARGAAPRASRGRGP